VIAESFERIHRSNLVGMGILPLQFKAGESMSSLGLTGKERFTIRGLRSGLKPGQVIEVEAAADGQGQPKRFQATCRLDNDTDVEYLRHGGILPMVLRQMLPQGKQPARS
jgi:aconitate hydratase